MIFSDDIGDWNLPSPTPGYEKRLMTTAEDSWWTRPSMQTDRLAFHQHVVASEIERMNNSSRFGSGKSTHDKFITDKPK